MNKKLGYYGDFEEIVAMELRDIRGTFGFLPKDETKEIVIEFWKARGIE